MRNVLSIKVADKYGALSRITELFVSRGYNLHSISSGVCEEEGTHRMTLVSEETEMNLKRIVKLLEQIIYVYEVTIVDLNSSFIRELLLVKINFREEKISEELREILSITSSLKCNVVELNDRSICFEYIGNAKQLDSLISVIRRFDIAELARTGEAAIHK